ncbi:MAG TPA: YhcH/YjgK/YiaL family protein [Candidatus Hydrogenedens sp.]|nr:YhcH/YjgK/YiaL family protein [Candidatus Hydrogenedens sp.]HOK08862.1 YhcH/YjgK/YiaL family protein [Candidatus Hydrogenedens sp.]HOL20352.1 YhcH/YjgK/YiaL family protein [Candidatus Hydrogenedens sp.]HPP59990.1 YhcH/YjgK/YiaL family protein [Candidatus Hydrogenedens sp.]
MIIDHLENWNKYFHGELTDTVFAFIKGLSDKSPETEMLPLIGDVIKTRVMSYTTKDIKDAVFESHKKYMDIQLTITGEEKIAWLPEAHAKPRTNYDQQNDVTFYHVEPNPNAIVLNSEGLFVVLFPGEVHGTGIWIENSPKTVKKAVIKIKYDEFLKSR